MSEQSGPADVAVRFQDAWNAHDMAAFGRLFHADASFVNRFGTYWRGVAEIVAGHERIHASIYRDSTLENEVADVDFLSSEAAILHIWSRLNAGEAHPGGRIGSIR